ncbi:ABC transporter ATP-binding protein [Desulfospira joergensenii]|uniref:ABC transporter ATP-binding protein n=1 Tax=Desulfospira joergensenii TaxID=53329 RepID=UPI0003B4DA05|nr:sn-glycerol-3-phosphate ABC transporter ATP-binding protein UgpC [Desulfospira joergensenii]
MASLSIENVKKQFGKTVVLRDICLDITHGEFLVLVGPSGCGKSTLLNLIAGLETISDGVIRIGEKDVTHVPPKDRDIAMVFQSYALYPNMNVRKNISFGLETRKMARPEIKKQVEKVAAMLQIEDLLDRKPAQLSGGQRQRVAMGRALAREPAIFLFDEPLSNLDAKLRVDMRTEIKLLHQKVGTTIVYVTHDQIEAMTLADRIAVMKDGVIQQFGSPREIYDNPSSMFVAGFIGSPAMNFIPCELGEEDGEYGILLTAGQDETCFIPAGGLCRNPGDLAGKSLVLGLRPEQIGAALPGDQILPPMSRLTCRVDVVEPTGPDTLVFTRINRVKTTCRIHPDRAVAPGQTMDLTLDTSKAVLFDSAAGTRIQ